MTNNKTIYAPVSSFGKLKPSPIMQNILQTIEKIAASDLGVLIVGEQGTEKEWLARTIHRMSGRADHEFVNIDCSTPSTELVEKEIFGFEELTLTGIEIYNGIFEEAAGGTIFFDHISMLPVALQTKIARVLAHQSFRHMGGFEEIGINIRVIASSVKNPSETVEGMISGHEYSLRIWPVIINLPPLRERRDDILFLIQRSIIEASDRYRRQPPGITTGAISACLAYNWPGNAHELQRTIDLAVTMCHDSFIQREHLPNYIQEYSEQFQKVVMQETFNL
jgi:DNA-binding NtrC family response regulator